MREDRPDASLLIGLHKLAEQNGDGLVPELYLLLSERSGLDADSKNVVAFPADRRHAAGRSTFSKNPARLLSFRR